jgi:galactose-6-phosphate isomerase
MATLDVGWVALCPEFVDVFEVVRRPELVTMQGRTETYGGTTIRAFGTLYPTGDNSLVRQDDYTRAAKTMTIVTPFRLRMSAPGFQPDFVLYRGNTFVVTNVQDYTQYGDGFVVAECSTRDAQDAPPQ